MKKSDHENQCDNLEANLECPYSESCTENCHYEFFPECYLSDEKKGGDYARSKI